MDNRARALCHADAVCVSADHLRDLHNIPENYREAGDQRRIQSINAELGISLKLAEVYALLEVADAIRETKS